MSAHRFLIALLVGTLVAPGTALATPLQAKNARIVEVTVFPDRAEVVREACG